MQLLENRHLNPIPPVHADLASLEAFPAGFEGHYNDHFGFRRRLINFYSQTKFLNLGDVTHSQVLAGRDGLRFSMPGAPDGKFARSPASVHGRRSGPVGPEAGELATRLARRAELPLRLHAGAEKQSVHVQYLLDSLKQRLDAGTRFDQFRDYLNTRTRVSFVDLREPLRRLAQKERLYIRTDAHWNELGAYYAYVHIMQSLQAHFPNLEALPRSAFTETIEAGPRRRHGEPLGRGRACHSRPGTSPGGEGAKAKAVDSEVAVVAKYCMAGWKPSVYEQSDKTLPRAVLTGDSFCWRLLPFLAEHFSRLVYLPEYIIDTQALESERPAVVIAEMAERHLDLIQPEDPLLP